MKKCLAMLMILCILVSFSGCGSPGAQSAGPVDGERPGEAGQAGEEKPSFPEKAITLIIPVAAGSGADIHGRKLASIAEKYLGQPIIVENIAGGNQAVGTVAMLNREADGYTVCQTSPSLCTLFMAENAPFKREDLQPIAAFNAEPNGFTVRGDSGFETMRDVIDYAIANPKSLKIGSSGSGSNQHLTIELLAKRAGLSIPISPMTAARTRSSR